MSKSASQPLFWPKGSLALPIPVKLRRARFAMQLAALFATTARRSGDLQTLQHEACRVAAEGLEADCVRLLIYQAKDREPVIEAEAGWRPTMIDRPRSETHDRTEADIAWFSNETIICNNLEIDESGQAPNPFIPYGSRRKISVCLPGAGEVAFGLLEAEGAMPEEFATDDANFVQIVAQSLATARERLLSQALYEQQAARSFDEHTTSLHELQHRIRNDLQGISSSIAREARSLDSVEPQAGYDRISRRVLALAALYDHLLGRPTADIVEMDAYLGSLCLKIADASDLSSRGITLDAETQPIKMSIVRAGRIAVAVNELVANAAEHAFPRGRAGRIVVCLLSEVADGRAYPVVTVSDDGCGFGELRPGRAGLGFVDRLVRGAGGVLTRVDGVGCKWQITLTE